jgi:hypothetical protein
MLFAKYRRLDIDNIKVGDEIEIISFPRQFDGADAYAGIRGIVTENDPNDKFRNGQVGWITLSLYGKGWFTGHGTKNRMKFKILNKVEN